MSTTIQENELECELCGDVVPKDDTEDNICNSCLSEIEDDEDSDEPE